MAPGAGFPHWTLSKLSAITDSHYSPMGPWELTPRQGAGTRSVSPWCLGEHLASSRHSRHSCWKLQWHEVKSGTRRALVGLTRRENRQYFGKEKSKLQHLQLIHEVILRGTTPKGHALLHPDSSNNWRVLSYNGHNSQNDSILHQLLIPKGLKAGASHQRVL